MKDTRDMMVKDYDTCTDEELIARLRGPRSGLIPVLHVLPLAPNNG